MVDSDGVLVGADDTDDAAADAEEAEEAEATEADELDKTTEEDEEEAAVVPTANSGEYVASLFVPSSTKSLMTKLSPATMLLETGQV